MKKYLGPLAVLAAAIIPVILWYIHASELPLFSNMSVTLRTLGRVAGIVGMSLFAVNLILAARMKSMEPFFDGLPAIYAKHHIIGSISFILLLFHPILLGAQFLSISVAATAQFFIPSFSFLPLLAGTTALIIMILSLFLTYFVRIAYPKWRFSHQFLGLAFIIGCYHAFFMPSDVSQFFPLKLYMFIISFAGIAAFFYRSVLGKIIVKQYAYTVKQINRLNDTVSEIILSPVGHPMPYSSGQFAFVRFSAPNISSEPHPFSVISRENDPEVRFAVKNLGDFTSHINEIPVGSIAKLEGGYGKLSVMGNSERDQIWIAGGIGVTPFVGMARSLPMNEWRQIDFYYSVRNPGETVYLDVFRQVQRKTSGFKVFTSFSDTQGHLTATKIASLSSNVTDKEIFICGPVPMMQSLRKQLRLLGVPNNQIHTEEFALK